MPEPFLGRRAALLRHLLGKHRLMDTETLRKADLTDLEAIHRDVHDD